MVDRFMNSNELEKLLRNALLRDRQSALKVLKSHAWLLIPDVRCDLLSSGRQGVCHSVRFGPELEADFVTYEIVERQVNWQLTYIASPSAAILENAVPSIEFAHALRQIALWTKAISHCENRLPVPLPILNSSAAFSYRIVIGQSRPQTDDERHEIQRHRRSDLRIRSFDWLIEKLSHYSPSELSFLETSDPVKAQ